MQEVVPTIFIVAGLLLATGCKRSDDAIDSRRADSAARQTSPTPKSSESETSNAKDENHADGEDHAHDEVPLGKVKIGDLEVELAQGHGKIEAGKEGHLVVKLPYNDRGQSVVRAWLGTNDRTYSLVAKAQYASSHDDYDVHAVAPDPLPENVMWWIEIEKPDGNKQVGSMNPLM